MEPGGRPSSGTGESGIRVLLGGPGESRRWWSWVPAEKLGQGLSGRPVQGLFLSEVLRVCVTAESHPCSLTPGQWLAWPATVHTNRSSPTSNGAFPLRNPRFPLQLLPTAWLVSLQCPQLPQPCHLSDSRLWVHRREGRTR